MGIQIATDQRTYHMGLTHSGTPNDCHDRRKSRLNELTDKIEDHIQYLSEVSLLSNLKQLIEITTKAILDGYNRGVAENRGRVLRAGVSQ